MVELLKVFNDVELHFLKSSKYSLVYIHATHFW